MKTLLGLLLLSLCGFGQATEFRVCADNRGIAPYVYMDGVGIAQYLAVHAAENLKLQLRLEYHPQPRCMAELAHDRYDALLIASPNPAMDQVVGFPKDAQGAPDQRFSYGHYRVVAFKLRDSSVDWNGRHFTGLDRPLLYQSGVPTVELVVSKLEGQNLASARTPQSMIDMMRLGRASAGIVMEPLLLNALREQGREKEFVVLEPALLESNAYMAMSKHLLQRNPQLANRVWEEIRRIRSAPHWPLLFEQALAKRLSIDSVP